MAKVAFLGLGVMGYPMAGHLAKKGGHAVTVYNRTAAKAEKWAGEFGGRTASTPREAAEAQEIVFEEAPMVPLAHAEQLLACRACFRYGGAAPDRAPPTSPGDGRN